MNISAGRSVRSQAVPLRMRRDLVIQESFGREGTLHTIKDPVTLQHFRYLEEEFFLLSCLNGKASRDDIRARFEARFPGKRLSLPHLEKLITNFFYQGLVVADRSGAGDRLYDRYLKSRGLDSRWSLDHLLAVRLRGVSLRQPLDWVEAKVNWLIEPLPAIAALLFVFFTLGFAVLYSAEIAVRLPSFREYLSPRYLGVMLVVIACTKVVHELGHAMVCRRFGAECNEIGLMLLFFMPCLYCEVSDSWSLESRWKRAAVAGAGIAVECLIAAISFWGWWLTYPGVLNAICLQLAVVCSVNSLLINGQPLLRYDGYFVLSDLTNRPNLWGASRRMLNDIGSAMYLKPSRKGNEFVSRQDWFTLIYGLLSRIYQGFAVAFMVWFIYEISVLYDVVSLFWFLSACILMISVGRSAYRMIQASQNPLVLRRFSGVRLSSSLIAGWCLVLLLLFVPIPWDSSSFGLYYASQSQSVIAVVGGRLTSVVESGRAVKAGDVIASMENKELALSKLQKEVELQRAKGRLSGLLRKRTVDSTAASELRSVEQQVSGLEQEVALLSQSMELLTIRALEDGVCAVPRRRDSDKETEVDWKEPLLTERNLGAFVERGTRLATVEHPGSAKFLAYFRESEVAGVRSGQSARVLLRRVPHQVLHGTVNQITLEPTNDVPEALLEESLIGWSNSSQESKSSESVYRVEIDLAEDHMLMASESIGRVWISTPSVTLWSVLMRSIYTNLRL